MTFELTSDMTVLLLKSFQWLSIALRISSKSFIRAYYSFFSPLTLSSTNLSFNICQFQQLLYSEKGPNSGISGKIRNFSLLFVVSETFLPYVFLLVSPLYYSGFSLNVFFSETLSLALFLCSHFLFFITLSFKFLFSS